LPYPPYLLKMVARSVLVWLGRVDLATLPWHRIAVVASLRRSVLSSFRGESIGITSLGVSLRIV
jgi:hypothetical protein